MKSVRKCKRTILYSFILLILCFLQTAYSCRGVIAQAESYNDGYISIPYDEQPYTEEELAAIKEMEALQTSLFSEDGEDDLPEQYGSVDEIENRFPSAKEQGDYDTCWSFAVTGCAEFDMISQEKDTKETADYSEMQLIYNVCHTAADKLGNLGEDRLTSESRYRSGNNTAYVQHILANWKGYATESAYAYSDIASFTATDDIAYRNEAARLVNCMVLSKSEQRDQVKEAIMCHGAVQSSYYNAERYYVTSQEGELLYYNPNANSSNHAVMMVGWDDNFSRENWPEENRPAEDGAWLMRNSYSDKAYFWISYADAGHKDAVYVMEFCDEEAYDNLYQYDGSPFHVNHHVYKAANVFQAENPDGNEEIQSEELEAVMISRTKGTSGYLKIEIYTGLTDLQNPESGQLQQAATTYGVITGDGIYTIPLEESVPLAPGEYFAIVLSAVDDGKFIDIDRESSTRLWGDWTVVGQAAEGQSLYQLTADESWADAADSDFGNYSIKGLMSNAQAVRYTIDYELNGGYLREDCPSSYAVSEDETPLGTPGGKEGYHFTGWYLDEELENPVTMIPAGATGELTLYAGWEAHSHTFTTTEKAGFDKSGIIEQTCENCDMEPVEISISPIEDVEQEYDTITYDGTAKTPSVTLRDGEGNTLEPETDYILHYAEHTNSGQAKIHIQLCGNYEGKKTLEFTIEAKGLTEEMITVDETALTYTGTPLLPQILVKDNDKELEQGVDYQVVGKRNTYPGEGEVIVKGIGNYQGELAYLFRILPASLTSLQTTLEYASATFDWTRKTPKAEVTGLRVGTDYTVSYQQNLYAGTATVIFSGIGSYVGTASHTFTISKKDGKDCTVALSSSRYDYDGTVKTPSVIVKDGTRTLMEGYDYTLSYDKGRILPGSYNVTVSFCGSYTGTEHTKSFVIVPKPVKRLTAKLSGDKSAGLSWTASPGVTGYKLYYKRSGSSIYKYYGTVSGTSATVSHLTGGSTYTFEILPYHKDVKINSKRTTSGSVTALKRVTVSGIKTSGTGVTLSWKNIPGETGYQISQSTKKNTTRIVSTYKTTSGKNKTVTAAKGKTFYYKVRAYRLVNGKKVYGQWSAVKKYKRL